MTKTMKRKWKRKKVRRKKTRRMKTHKIILSKTLRLNRTPNRSKTHKVSKN
jgi:hypothetical protein